MSRPPAKRITAPCQLISSAGRNRRLGRQQEVAEEGAEDHAADKDQVPDMIAPVVFPVAQVGQPQARRAGGADVTQAARNAKVFASQQQ
jgi:hypothetical protein